MNHKCLYCFARLFSNLLEKHVEEEEKKIELTKSLFRYISEIDTTLPSPVIARDIHAMLRQYLNNPDPYKEEKDSHNKLILSVYDYLKEKIRNSSSPFDEALKLTIAGNIMDFGPYNEFNIMETIFQMGDMNIAINHSKELQKQIEKAESILYLGDNAGEIVFDRLFLETIAHPNVFFAVRGGPVINDATMEDAKMAGIDKMAKIIDNGYDAPATIPEKSSEDFRRIYEKADLIISKGMGNFEGLMHRKDERIFFLLMVKCEVIGEHLGLNKGDIVIYNQNSRQ
ncbi:MAG: damage-control phosphatase ARMT1 family protein [Bacteroidales bacterium]